MSCPPPTRPDLRRQAPPQVDGAPERNRTPHKRSDGDGGGTERAGARERRHADRLSRSIRRTHFHLGADCSIGSPDSSGAHGLSTALSVRNGAGTRRARGWRTHTLSSIGSASALSVLCTAHHRAYGAG